MREYGKWIHILAIHWERISIRGQCTRSFWEFDKSLFFFYAIARLACALNFKIRSYMFWKSNSKNRYRKPCKMKSADIAIQVARSTCVRQICSTRLTSSRVSLYLRKTLLLHSPNSRPPYDVDFLTRSERFDSNCLSCLEALTWNRKRWRYILVILGRIVVNSETAKDFFLLYRPTIGVINVLCNKW